MHLPESPKAIAEFESKICDFYVAQVEKQLNLLELKKEQKVEIIKGLANDFRQISEKEFFINPTF